MTAIDFKRVLQIADDANTHRDPKSLLTIGTANPKVGKGEKRGYRTAIMHLSPANLSGFEVCAGRTAGCTAACLNTAGRGGMDTAKPSAIHTARLRRTRFFKRDKRAFGLMLERELEAHVKSAKRAGMIPVVRLNGTSDLPWENVKFQWRLSLGKSDASTVFDRFPDVQFYDYTKVIARLRKPLPANYDLTFSLADGNDPQAAEALRLGFRVAAVFGTANPGQNKWPLPTRYHIRDENGRAIRKASAAVIDADETDLRFLDPPRCIVGLRAKGLAKKDTTGFVKFV